MPIVQVPSNNGFKGPQDNVAYENVGAGTTATNGTPSSYTHFSFGGPLCCVVMTYSIFYSTATPTFAFSFGGQALTDLGGVTYLTGANVLFTGIAYKLGGIPNGTSTVVATATGGTVHDFAVNTVSFQNVGGFPASNNAVANNTNTAATCSLTSPPGCSTLAVISPNGQGLTGINHPFIWNDSLFNSITCVIPNTTTNRTATFSATLTAATNWGEILFSMSPPPYTSSLVGPRGRALGTAIPRASTF
jgi:hypothetical protein